MSVLKFAAWGLVAPAFTAALALAAESPTDVATAASGAREESEVAETAGNREGRPGAKPGHPTRPTARANATTTRWWQHRQPAAQSGGAVDLLTAQGPDAASTNARRPKVTLCHCGSDHCVTISVADRAVPAHLGHGDALGACPGDETPSEP